MNKPKKTTIETTSNLFRKDFKMSKLLASSSNIEGITQIINAYFYSEDIYLESKNKNTWILKNKKKPEKEYSFQVILKGGRYRFEMI